MNRDIAVLTEELKVRVLCTNYPLSTVREVTSLLRQALDVLHNYEAEVEHASE